MLIQQKYPKKLSGLSNILVALMVLLSIGLAACGGGGGGGGSVPAGGGTVGLTYVGNTNPAAVTTTNASEIVDGLIGGAGLIESFSDVQPSAVADPSFRDSLVSALNSVLSLTRKLTVAEAVARPDYQVAALVPVDETLLCDSGSISLTGSIDDQSGTGVLTVAFNACTYDSETIDGTGTLTVRAFDLTYFAITDGVFDFPLMTATSAEADVSMSFDMHMQLFINQNLERFTLNMVGQDNTSGDMASYENFIEENLYYPSMLTPTSYSQIMRGRVYDSTHGYVDFFVPEVSPLDYSSILQVYPDTGVLVFDGDNCNLRLVTQSSTHVGFNLDSDGDGVHETGVTLLWEEIGQPVAADIGDNDGDQMHNSWETVYGLNPDDAADALLDYDGDGASNYQEYLDRTDPTASPGQTVYEYTGNYYTFALSPYTTSMYVTATILVDSPLANNLNLADITGASGFVLTMNDGIATLASTSPGIDIIDAFISTDASGSIVGWALALQINGGLGILSDNSLAGMVDATVDNATATTNASVIDNIGTWTGPTVAP